MANEDSRYSSNIPWPAPLSNDALYGVAGEFVNLVEPHTEADRVALLAQFLAAAGNLVGPAPYFRVEADTHHLKLFPVLVGETSKARKGVSLGHVKNIFKTVGPEWVEKRIMKGLSSGEGLIWHVRDEAVNDLGEPDKRLFVVETEFASTLRVIGRDGNTLSPIIREAWDDGNLQTLTKNSPIRATGAHISIVGHITKDELRRYLNRTEIGNGFANRFLWVCVKRSKVLPEGGRIHEVNLAPTMRRLKETVEFGKKIGEIKKDHRAKQMWADIYPELSEGKRGLFGAVISRAEAQVMRIASIHAVLDKSYFVREKHLLAALALWKYSEASARYIFGEAIGDSVADRILNALKDSSDGLTRTKIYGLFSNNVTAERIDEALSFLMDNDLAWPLQEGTKGRPVETWRAF